MTSQTVSAGLIAKHLETLMYRAPAGFLMVDGNGRIRFVNRLVETMFNYSREELIGQPIEMLIPERYRNAHVMQREAFVSAPSSRKMGTGRVLHARAKDGREFPVEVGLGHYRIAEVIFVSAVIVDISKQRAVEQERERLILELKSALGKVKQLSGLLPICSSCKKIRDDTGYWNQIESYISTHSEADFSHGLCPDCLETLYPDLDDDGP
jgi:PAS domain S-box-containing protein